MLNEHLPVRARNISRKSGLSPARMPDSTGRATAVELLVGLMFGCEVTLVNSEQIGHEKSARRGRLYFKHVLAVSGQERSSIFIFTKSGMKRKKHFLLLERFLSDLVSDQFRVPLFFGTANLAGSGSQERIGIWEFVTGRSSGSLRSLSHDDLLRMTGAVAAMNMATEEAISRIPNLPIGMRYLTEGTDDERSVHRSLARDGHIRYSTTDVDRLELLADAARKRLQSMGSRYFSHHDVTPSHFFFENGKPPTIIDWESASIGPIGAGLRLFAFYSVEVQKEMASYYVSLMESRGQHLNENDVLFGMRAVHVLASLRRAARHPDSAIRGRCMSWCLDHADYLKS